MIEAYCENGECDVILYRVADPDKPLARNCPSCGRMGRLKDEKGKGD